MPVHIPARKSGIASRHIHALGDALPDGHELLVALTPQLDLPIHPTVTRGDRVEPGTPLSRPAADHAVRAFSPADAVVAELTTVDTEYACELPAVRLRLVPRTPLPQQPPSSGLGEMPGPAIPQADGSAAPHDLRSALADLARIEDLPATLDELGVLATCAGRLESMGGLLRRASGRTKLLVINAIQSEPRLASHVRLTLDATAEIAAGAKALCTYLGLRRCSLLVSAAHGVHPLLARRLRRARVRVLPVRTTFPGGEDSIVVRRIFNRSVPYGGDSLHAGVLVLPADAVWRAGVALMHNKPALDQPVTVAGDCLPPAGQRVYLLPIGLTIEGLIGVLARRGLLLRQPKIALLGGPLTGTAVVDPGRTVVTAATQAVLLMSSAAPLHVTGCIRCGWCIRGCPVGIDPIAILDALEAGQLRSLLQLAPERCIRCGVCSAICPSHLPLAQAARTARALLARQGR
jgi:electron transport complex protein RnfC